MTSAEDAAALASYKDARDALITRIETGGGPIEIEIRNRRVRYADPILALKQIEALISFYEQKCAQVAGGNAVNHVRFKKC